MKQSAQQAESKMNGGRPVRGQLIIEDEYLATWMTINNTFTRRPGEIWNVHKDKKYCGGVLLQVGSFYDPPLRELTEEELRGCVKISLEKLDNSKKPLTLKPFKWLNIVPEARAGKNPPMEDKHQAYVVPDRRQDLGKRLHAYFLPLSTITYWHGPKRYTMSVDPAPVDHDAPDRHNQYTFQFHDPVKIYVDSKLQEGYDSVRIEDTEHCFGHTNSHQDHVDPPW